MSDTSDDSVDSVIAVHDPRRLRTFFPASSTSATPKPISQATASNLSKPKSSTFSASSHSSLQPPQHLALKPDTLQTKTKDCKSSNNKQAKADTPKSTANTEDKKSTDHQPLQHIKVNKPGKLEIKEISKQTDDAPSKVLRQPGQKESPTNQDPKDDNAVNSEKEGNTKRRRRNRKKSKESPIVTPDSPKSLDAAIVESRTGSTLQKKPLNNDKQDIEQDRQSHKKGKQEIPKDSKKSKPSSSKGNTDESKTEPLVTREAENVANTIAESPVEKNATASSEMGNKFSSERNKGSKDVEGKKKDKEAKKKNKGKKSKSPTSDKESSVGNRSSIETTDSYSSAATLVASANAAIGRRSPKKSPRAIPRSGVKLRDAISSDDESFASAGFKTPQATTPLMKRSVDPSSPSQRLLEFGRNIERDITEKFINKSPISGHFKKDSGDKNKKGNKNKIGTVENPHRESREPPGASVLPEKLFSSLPKRCSKDVTIETDSDSFGIFENTDRLYASLPKDYYPIDDNLSDDVFMSCIDLASNNPDIPLRSQTSPAPRSGNQMHSSPVTTRKDGNTNQSKSPKTPHKQMTSPLPTHSNPQSSTVVAPPPAASNPSPASIRRTNADVPKSPLPIRRTTHSPAISRKTKADVKQSPASLRRNEIESSKSATHASNPTNSPSIQRRQVATEAPKSPSIPKHNPASQLASSSKEGSKSPGRSRRRRTPTDDSKSPTLLRSEKSYSPNTYKSLSDNPNDSPGTRRRNQPSNKQSKGKEVSNPKQKKSPELPMALNTAAVPSPTQCSKAEEENTNIKGSPKTPKQDNISTDMSRKKEHLKSTYDNVPDSDDSMVYFTSKNDPVFFEDNCVSEEILATEKTPLHYKVEETTKFGIEILKPPTQGKIECVLLEREKRLSKEKVESELKRVRYTQVMAAPSETNTTTNLASNNPTKPNPMDYPDKVINITKAEKPTAKSANNPTKPNTMDGPDKVINITKMEKPTAKSSNKPSEPKKPEPRSTPSPTILRKPVSELSSSGDHPPKEETTDAVPTEQLTKRQIRRRNKRKNLKMGSKGSLDSSSDAPLSPQPTPTEDPSLGPFTETKETLEYIKGDKTLDTKEDQTIDTKLSVVEIEDLETKNSQQKTLKDNNPVSNNGKDDKKRDMAHKSGKGGENSLTKMDELTPMIEGQGYMSNKEKRDHVPPPSPSANDTLMEIAEEDEDEEGAESKLVDEKAKEVLVFGESVLKRLSSLVESQGDSNDLDRRFQLDFDDDEVDQTFSQTESLQILDEICDMGEKFKQEIVCPQEFEVKVSADQNVSQNSEPAIKTSDIVPAAQSPVLKRPSIPCELQLIKATNISEDTLHKIEKDQSSKTFAIPAPDYSVDTRQIPEVTHSFSDEVTPGHMCDAEQLRQPEGATAISNPTSIVFKESVVSSDEEFYSPLRRFTRGELTIPPLEETFGELMSVKNILQNMEDKTPTGDVLPKFIGLDGMTSPASFLIGSGRRSRMSPAITERTESELDMSEQLDNVSISTDSMYADDEDDGAEMIFNKTYTEDKGECLVSCTFYNTAHDYDSDEFWAESSAMDENYKVLETSANEASCTFKKARSEMHDIQRHLQDLRRQMEHLQEDVQTTSITPGYSMGSSEWRPITE